MLDASTLCPSSMDSMLVSTDTGSCWLEPDLDKTCRPLCTLGESLPSSPVPSSLSRTGESLKLFSKWSSIASMISVLAVVPKSMWTLLVGTKICVEYKICEQNYIWYLKKYLYHFDFLRHWTLKFSW